MQKVLKKILANIMQYFKRMEKKPPQSVFISGMQVWLIQKSTNIMLREKVRSTTHIIILIKTSDKIPFMIQILGR